MRKFTGKHTVTACFIGYIVQAIVNNYIPLLFLTFHNSYGISMEKITLLVTINFALQMAVDVISATFIDKIGYRASAILAHAAAAAGFLLLTILPDVMPDPFVGILIAVLVYAVGGGLLEVIISPIVEACPTDNKESAMSMLHSFYCWGHVGVVLLSTLFFTAFGIQNWKILALLWMIVPLLNLLLFTKVPIYPLIADGETRVPAGTLLKKKAFWLLMIMMICAGASEQGVSQWASTYAELALGVPKAIGDLAGPMLFAIAMGASRAIYGKYGDRMDLNRFMIGSTILCVCSYLIIALTPWAPLGLLGYGICGFSVGIMWPGTFSTAAATIRNGGTLMFALFALGGDIGCSGGPTFVGLISSALGDSLKTGILFGVIFPIMMLAGLLICKKIKE